VKQLKPGGAAEVAGCQPGDVIAAVQETVVLTSAGDWADLWSLGSVKAAIDAIPNDRPLFVCLVDGDKYDSEVASLLEDEAEPSELATPAYVQEDTGENNAVADDVEAPAPVLTPQTQVTALKPSALAVASVPEAAVEPIAVATATATDPVAEVLVAEAPVAEAPVAEAPAASAPVSVAAVTEASAPAAPDTEAPVTDRSTVRTEHLAFSDLVFGLPTRTVVVDVPVDASLGWKLTMPGTESYGVRIQSIVAGSPTGAAGARRGDLIVAVNETAVLTSTGDWADIWDVTSIERTIQHTRDINPNTALIFTVVDEDDYDDKVQTKLAAHWTNEPEAKPNPEDNVLPAWMDDGDDEEEEALDDQGLSDNENIEPDNVTTRSDAWGDTSDAKRRVSFVDADLERKARAVENDLDRLTDSLRVRNETSFSGVPRSPAVSKSPARRNINVVTPMSARSTASFGGSPVTPLTPLSPNLPRPAGDRLSSSLLGMPSYQGIEESIMATSLIGSRSKPMTSSYSRPVDDYLDVSTTRDIMEQVELEQRSEQRSKLRADPNVSLRPGGRYNGGAGMSSAERMEFEAEIDDLQLRLEQLSKQYTKTEGARTLLEDRIRILDNEKDDDAYRLRQASLETANTKSRMNALTSETDHANAETAKMKAKWAAETDKVIQLLSQCQRYADTESEMQSQISVMQDQIEVQEQMDAQNANVIASLKRQNNDLLKEGTATGLRLSELEATNRERETANGLMEAQLRSASGDHASFRESANAQLASAQFENRSLTDKMKDLTKRLADSEDEKFQLEMKLSTSVSKFESATSGQQHESAKVQQLTSDNADMRTKLIAASTLQTELNHASDRISGLEDDLATSRQDVSRLTIELADASEANNKAMYDAARSSEAFSDFEGRVANGIKQAEEAARALIQKDQDLLNERQRFDASLREMEASHSGGLARASLEMSSLRELYDGLELEVAKERGEKERLRQNMSRQQAALNEGADLETELRAALERSDSRLNQIETEKTQVLTDLGKARSDMNALLAQLAASKETAGMLEVAVKTLRSDNASLKLQASDHQQDIATLSKHKQELESILMQSDTLGKDLKGRLEDQMARGSALEGGIEGLSAQKKLNIKMMSEMQGKILELENKLAEAEAARDAAEARADENVRLWESEVKSRSKLGLKVMEMEKHAAAWEDRLIRERQRTAAAVGRKRELESKLDNVYQRSGEFEGQAAASSERLRAAQRELELYKAGTIRSAPAEAEVQSIRAEAEAEKARLTAELSSAHQEAELAAAARANEAVARATAIGNLVPKSQLEDYKRSLESQANKRINASIQAVNSELAHVQLEHEHKVHDLAGQVTHAKTDLASQTLSRIRAESELTGMRRGDSAEALARSRLALRVTEARSKLNESKSRLHAQAPSADLSSSTASSRAAVARARARAQQLLNAARMQSNR
jgi:chromosome segregation ATPase